MPAEGTGELLGLVPHQIHLSFEGAVGGLQQFLTICGILHLQGKGAGRTKGGRGQGGLKVGGGDREG